MALVDVLAPTDFILNSPIAQADGQVCVPVQMCRFGNGALPRAAPMSFGLMVIAFMDLNQFLCNYELKRPEFGA